MQVKNFVYLGAGVALGCFTFASAGRVQAAFFDRDKLAQALSVRFHLNVQEVSNFLADFQYNPDMIVAPAATATPTATPRSTTTPVTYQYDAYTDRYFPGSDGASVQRRSNLAFIAEKLTARVAAGKMTATLKQKILNKLAVMMDASPSSAEFAAMSTAAQNRVITSFRKEMDAWLRTQGMTLAELREITSKGNKFLMGIYLE
jgi:hypothetical protein